MANNQNLTQAGKSLSAEEAQRKGAKGGKASGEARRRRKAFKESFEAILSMPLKEGNASDPDDIQNYAAMKGKNLTVQEAITIATIRKAMKGDVRAAEYIRDTIGENPINKIDIDMDAELNINIDYGGDDE